MSNIICVTHRKLCNEDFLLRIERIAKIKPRAIILREKDLNSLEYEELALKVLEITNKFDVQLVLNGHANLAEKLDLSCQLPFSQKNMLKRGGLSIHSVEEAKEANSSNADWLIAGHIWSTDCKKGLEGRGLDFLKDVVSVSEKEVFAIGGITLNRLQEVQETKAAGACIMSYLMTCNPKNLESLHSNF